MKIWQWFLGSFKPPHKGHWDMILEYLKLADKVYIFISNISTKIISQRILSKSNLQSLAKLIDKFQDNKTKYKDKDLTKFIENNFSILINNADNLTYNFLKEKIEQIINKINLSKINDENKIEYNNLLNDLEKIISNLNSKLFASVRNTENNIEIEPEISKQIFEIFINRYNLSDKVFVEISQMPSPMTAVIAFVNSLCKDCTIYLGSSKKGGDDTRWNSFLKSFQNNPTNIIIEYPVNLKTNLSATELRNNITSLKKEWFPDKLTNDDFNKIKELLNNE